MARRPPRQSTPRRPPPAPAGRATAADRATADTLHSAAIRLLRRLRTEDDASGLSAPRASALSVLVFGGPCTLGELARAEQVRPPTISRLIADMTREGLVTVVPDPADGRVRRAHATARGRQLLVEGRKRRVARLARALADLPARSNAELARLAPTLLALARQA